MIRISRLWREPLVHFLAIGAGLFLVFDLTQPPAGDASNRIAVSAGQVEQNSPWRTVLLWSRPQSRSL
jgi:hypothetical protein